MDQYKAYFDRQTVSPSLHARLLDLNPSAPRPVPVLRWAALAACAALLIGAGLIGKYYVNRPVISTIPLSRPGETDEGDANAQPGTRDEWDSITPGPAGAKLMLPAVFSVNYPDAAGANQLAASIVLPEGSFFRNLDKEDIQTIFWGPSGKPEFDAKADPGDFPALLMGWGGYDLTGEVIYDGSGDLWRLTLRGKKGEDSFILTAAPGRIPISDCMIIGLDESTTDILGTQVTGWHQSYDRDGDREVEHIVTSQFMAGNYGVEFENVGAGGLTASETDGGPATELGGAMEFNAMLVNQLCRTDGGLYLDHIAHTDDIPVWREENFYSLAAARAETDFAPWLPTRTPEGFGEFFGRLSYQEGGYNYLFVRWSRGYDGVEVEVRLPEGESNDVFSDRVVDITIPESYDWRLYGGAICNSVPEEYQLHFYMPVFRAEDMSFDVVEARMTDCDTGGQSCHFRVLHDNGVVVGYSCTGVTAEYVWELVQTTPI